MIVREIKGVWIEQGTRAKRREKEGEGSKDKGEERMS